MSQASDQITEYLSVGGLFNPEIMNQTQHEAVRDTLIKARDDIQQLERENAALRKTIDAQADYQRELRTDRDRLDWLGSHQGIIECWEGDWYCEGQMFTSVRSAIDAAMREGKL